MQRKYLLTTQAEPNDRLLRYRPTIGQAAIYDSHDKQVQFNDMYAGYAAFLLCGGPSLARMDLEPLRERGMLTMAVNNACAVFKPNLWTHMDAPGRFLENNWLDATVMKFSMFSHHWANIRQRDPQSRELLLSDLTVAQLPNTWFYHADEYFDPNTYLTSHAFSCGCKDGATDSLGNVGSRSVMLIALKLLYVLGVRTVYLVGCDFRMQHDTPNNYAFPQSRAPSTIDANNRAYSTLNSRLSALRPKFEDVGYNVFNCTPNSGLNAFPHVPYEVAVKAASKVCNELPIITEGYYDT